MIRTDGLAAFMVRALGMNLFDDDLTGIPPFQRNKMVDGRQGDRMEAGINGIVTSQHGNLSRDPDLFFQQGIHDAEGDHIVHPRNGCQFPVFPQQLLRQCVAHLVLGIHAGDPVVQILRSRLDDHAVPAARLGKFSDKSLHSLQPLSLPGGKRRRRESHFPVAVVQQVARHQPPRLRIVQFYRVNFQQFFPVVDDNQRDRSRQLTDPFPAAAAGVAGIDDAERLYTFHHPEIILFDPKIPLGIADKNSVPFFLCHFLNALQQHDIIRIGQRRAEDYDQFLPGFLPGFSLRNLVPQLPRRFLHLPDGLCSEGDIRLPVEDHGHRSLGDACRPCHILRRHSFLSHVFLFPDALAIS